MYSGTLAGANVNGHQYGQRGLLPLMAMKSHTKIININ